MKIIAPDSNTKFEIDEYWSHYDELSPEMYDTVDHELAEFVMLRFEVYMHSYCKNIYFTYDFASSIFHYIQSVL